MRRFVSFSGSSAMTDEPPFFSDLLHVLRGRAINEYANVEQSLCRLFGTLLGTDLQLGAIVFYRITNTHSRNQILDDLLAEKHGLTYESYWSGVTGAPNRKNTGMWPLIRQLDQSRNEIVHWHVGFRVGHYVGPDYQGPAGLVKPDAWPLIRDPAKRVISMPELVQFIEKADFVHRSLNIFFMIISKEMPDNDDTRSLREIFRQPAAYPPEDTNPLSRNY
jgi:hypothetical protein